MCFWKNKYVFHNLIVIIVHMYVYVYISWVVVEVDSRYLWYHDFFLKKTNLQATKFYVLLRNWDRWWNAQFTGSALWHLLHDHHTGELHYDGPSHVVHEWWVFSKYMQRQLRDCDSLFKRKVVVLCLTEIFQKMTQGGREMTLLQPEVNASIMWHIFLYLRALKSYHIVMMQNYF